MHNITNATLMLKNMKCVLKKNGKIWANWRTKNDWLYKKGDYLSDGLYDVYKSTGREHSTNLFCDKSMI